MIKSKLLLFVLLISCFVFVATPKADRAQATGTIYIRADGSIDPLTAPISTSDNITYTLTGSITSDADGIVVERNNIAIDGVGYVLNGTSFDYSKGISLSERSNVTIKNMTIKAFSNGVWLNHSSDISISGNNITANSWFGIRLDSSSNNSISGNNITANSWFGIRLDSSSNNSISGNSITANNVYGIRLYSSSNNSISGNSITANQYHGIGLGRSSKNSISGNDVTANGWSGIVLMSSSANSISGNNIANNSAGIELANSSNCSIFHNNFVDNKHQVFSYNLTNTWDDGFPSGGNYWSDYSGTDSDHDGIGDTQYVVNATETDHFPLAGMFRAFSTPYGYWVGIISNSSISGFSFNLINPSQASLGFNVTGTTATEGFFRICIPKALIGDLYVVKLNKIIIIAPQVRELPCSNETYEYLYVNYTHSQQSIEITGTTTIAEFPIFLILPLFMIATLLAVIFCRRKHETD